MVGMGDVPAPFQFSTCDKALQVEKVTLWFQTLPLNFSVRKTRMAVIFGDGELASHLLLLCVTWH